MILSSGLSFGPYRIVGHVATGGMGEVYRARDTRLGREVALKILLVDTDHPRQARRFEQEARAASALNHPNIVVVYEVGEAPLAGRDRPLRYLAMELLDGKPLASLVNARGLPLRQVLDIAAQLADGLARAHESEIVHRDLKPSNVVVESDGRVKILDFGLAKLRGLPEDKPSVGTGDDTPSATSPGALLGTVGYMSPEQVRGETVTGASDQFALGCILHEMLTGRRAFDRPSPAETYSAILRDEPTPIAQLRPDVPPQLRWIVERCLAKDASDRYTSTRDLARDLKTLREHSSEVGVRSSPEMLPLPARRRSRLRLAAASLGLVAIGAGATFVLYQRINTPIQPEFRRLTYRRGTVWRALLAEHTNSILYTGSWEGAASGTYQTLPEASALDRVLDAGVQLPMRYSEDGTQVLVLLGETHAWVNLKGTLAWWPALGGSPRRILEGVGWADVAPRDGFLAVVRAEGAERLLDIREIDGGFRKTLFRTTGGVSFPRISPDGRWVAFIHHPLSYDDGGEVRIMAVDGTGGRVLTAAYEQCVGLDWNLRTGEIWYTVSKGQDRGSSLQAVSPSGRERTILRLPVLFSLQAVSRTRRRCLLALAEGQVSLFVHRDGESPRDVAWLGWSVANDVSPDGKSLLFAESGARRFGLWRRSLEGGDVAPIADFEFGRFSPDGRWIVGVTRSLTRPPQLVLAPAGGGPLRALTASSAAYSWPSFASPDRVLALRSHQGSRQVVLVRLDGSGESVLRADGCSVPEADPGGLGLACIGNDARRSILVFPPEGGVGRTLSTLPEGVAFAALRWEASSRRLFGLTDDRRLLTLDVATGGTLSAQPLPVLGPDAYGPVMTAAVSADGRVQAYSVERLASRLYVCDGLE